MSVLNGEITKITIAPYRGSTTLEADVKMLVEGQEVRRRWKSPHTSRTASERWAREKAKAFLTGRATKEKEPAPNFGEFAARYVEDHVRASRLQPSTAAHMHVSLNHHLIPMFGTLRVDQLADAHVLAVKKLGLAAGTINKILQLMGQALRDAQAEGAHHQRTEDQGARGQPRAPRLLHAGGLRPPRACDRQQPAGPRPRAARGRCGDADRRDRRARVEPGRSGRQQGPRGVLRLERPHRAAEVGQAPLGPDDAAPARPPCRRWGRDGARGAHPQRQSLRERGRAHHKGRRACVAARGPRARRDEAHGPRTLRHTFCSHLAMAGVPVTAIRDLAGHSSVAITQEYMHLAPAAMIGRDRSLRAFMVPRARRRLWRKPGEANPPARKPEQTRTPSLRRRVSLLLDPLDHCIAGQRGRAGPERPLRRHEFPAFNALTGGEIRGCMRHPMTKAYACKAYPLPDQTTLLSLFVTTPVGSDIAMKGLYFVEAQPEKLRWLTIQGCPRSPRPRSRTRATSRSASTSTTTNPSPTRACASAWCSTTRPISSP